MYAFDKEYGELRIVSRVKHKASAVMRKIKTSYLRGVSLQKKEQKYVNERLSDGID